MEEYKIGRRVLRIKGDYYVRGNKGVIVDVNENGRVRVKWDDRRLRTWVNIKFLEPLG